MGSTRGATMQPPLFDPDTLTPQPDPVDTLRRPNVTVEETLPAYERALVGARKARHTISSFLGDLHQLAAFYPRRPLPSLTTAHLQFFLGSLQRDKNLSEKSLTRKITSLKSYYRFLAAAQLVPHDAAALLIYPALQPQLPEILTDDDVARLLEATAEHPLWHALVATLRYAGPKREEALALRRGDITLEGTTPSITLRRRRPSRYNRDRTVPLPPPLRAILRNYLAELDGTLLFPLHVRSVQWGLSHHATQAGIARPVSAQTLRDTFAVAWLRERVELEADAERQGDRIRHAALVDAHDRRLLDLLGLADNTGVVAIAKYRGLLPHPLPPPHFVERG